MTHAMLAQLVNEGGIPPGITRDEAQEMALHHSLVAEQCKDSDARNWHMRWRSLCWDLFDTLSAASRVAR